VKFLIVKLSSLGDVVHAMPAVQDLRRVFPGAQIDWVVERAFAPLVSRCEGVRRVIPCELRAWRKKPFATETRKAWFAFKADLKVDAYDAIIDLQGLTKSALVCWLARTCATGKRYSLANQTDGSSYEAPSRWVADVAIELEAHVHAVERSRLLCSAAFKFEVDTPAQFGLKPGGQAVAQPNPVKHWQPSNPFVPRKPVVALVHGTSRADKEWGQDQWVELGRRLNNTGFVVALAHGNAAEKETSAAIAAQLGDTWMWPLMGLDALTDTMAHCAGVIGVDSGLSHIAVALGLPHVQIYNFDTAWRTGPLEAGASRQKSVFASPRPDLEAVWQAWESLATPVLCR
jgi:heptosyltransferase-1